MLLELYFLILPKGGHIAGNCPGHNRISVNFLSISSFQRRLLLLMDHAAVHAIEVVFRHVQF